MYVCVCGGGGGAGCLSCKYRQLFFAGVFFQWTDEKKSEYQTALRIFLSRIQRNLHLAL